MKIVMITNRSSESDTLRLETEARLDQVVAHLQELGIYGFALNKGECRLERDDGTVYIAIGPASAKHRKEFLRQVATQFKYFDRSLVPKEILGRATEVIGDSWRAWLWLTTPNPILTKIPLELLKEPDGAQQILDQLGRMEWGVYS